MSGNLKKSLPKIVWKPQAGSQSLLMSCPANFILLDGTRGGGKTDGQVMKFRANVGRGYGEYWRGIIFDRKYKSLDDIVAKTKKWFYKFNDGARFLSSKSDYKWVWPTGEELLIRHFEKPSDYDNYHGHEYPFIGWNELTKYPTSECFDKMMSCNRSSFEPREHSPDLNNPLPEIPLVVVSTTNPSGAGHTWVKKRKIDVAPAGRLRREEISVFNPKTQQREIVTKTHVRLFSSYKENRYLSVQYIAELEKIRDPNLRRAWLYGDWDITAGGAFDDLWKYDKHVVEPFEIPKEWSLYRSFDWGSTHPFSVGFWAESNGEEFKDNQGKTRCFPSGTLIRIGEIYGAKEINGEQFGHNQGCKMSAKDVARAVVKYQEDLKIKGIIKTDIEAGPADNQIFSNNESSTDSLSKMMEDENVTWTKSDKSSGSRMNGFELFRIALDNSLKNEGAGLYVFNTCKAFIETIPVLPRDEKRLDDVDTTAEDHVYDEVRYMILHDAPKYASDLSINIMM